MIKSWCFLVIISNAVNCKHLTGAIHHYYSSHQEKALLILFLETDLGFVPFLSLMDVLVGQSLILNADIPQCGSQIRLSQVHINLHMLILYLGLQLSKLLQAR